MDSITVALIFTWIVVFALCTRDHDDLKRLLVEYEGRLPTTKRIGHFHLYLSHNTLKFMDYIGSKSSKSISFVIMLTYVAKKVSGFLLGKNDSSELTPKVVVESIYHNPVDLVLPIILLISIASYLTLHYVLNNFSSWREN